MTVKTALLGVLLTIKRAEKAGAEIHSRLGVVFSSDGYDTGWDK